MPEARTRRRPPAGISRLVGVLLLAVAACGAERPSPPSIVLVTLDTVRCDHLGIHGDARGLSPHLDALAERGRVFERAFTTMPTTGPAHLSLFTGLYPSEHGARANGEPLAPELGRRSLALRLQRAGHATAAFVTTQLLSPRATGLPGFEIYDAPRGFLRPGAEAVEEALAWLAAERRRPLFLWVHLYDAHAPYGSAEQKLRALPLDRTRMGFVAPGRLREREERAVLGERYAAGVAAADAALGRLLDGLSGGFESPPLVVATGDHGEALDEHLETRGYAYDHGEFLDGDVVCVPLVLSGPGVVAGRVDAPVSLRDLYGTLLAAAGIETGGPDLRRAAPERRIVAVERRRLGPESDPRARIHAAAAFDREAGAIVAEDGSPSVSPAVPQAGELLGEARRHLRGADGAPAPETREREALEALGYLE